MPRESALRRPPALSRSAGLPPPVRLPSWGQPEGDEPIIDAARISLQAFGTGRSPSRTLAMFVWLRAIRPALTLAIWFVAVWYAWPYVLNARWQPEVLQLLAVYGVVVGVILVFMLLMAPMRHRQREREQPSAQEPPSLGAVASYIRVAPALLSAWQLTQQLLVRHDSHGHFENAADSRLGALDASSTMDRPAGSGD